MSEKEQYTLEENERKDMVNRKAETESKAKESLNQNQQGPP